MACKLVSFVEMDLDKPELDSNNRRWASFMGSLVVMAPSSDGISYMSASEFDLGIITHITDC